MACCSRFVAAQWADQSRGRGLISLVELNASSTSIPSKESPTVLYDDMIMIPVQKEKRREKREVSSCAPSYIILPFLDRTAFAATVQPPTILVAIPMRLCLLFHATTQLNPMIEKHGWPVFLYCLIDHQRFCKKWRGEASKLPRRTVVPSTRSQATLSVLRNHWLCKLKVCLEINIRNHENPQSRSPSELE